MPSTTHRSLALVLALALLAACKPAPTTAPAAQEGTISTQRGGATLTLAGHAFALRTLDGKAIDGLDLQVGSQAYHTSNGKLTLPDAAMAAIRERGAFLVRVPGYVPRKVAADATGDVSLVPLGPKLASATVGATGGQLAASDGAVKLGMPTGMLAQAAAVSVSSYQAPASDWNASAMAQERTALDSAAGHPDAGCDKPLPCPPPTASLGLLVDVQGPVQDATITLTYDLAALARDGNQAAVDRIRATFAAMDATGDPAWRQALQAHDGVTLVGDQLTFPVKVGDGAFNDGVARIEVDALAVLGVYLEVTVASQAPSTPGGTGPSTAPRAAAAPGDVMILGNFGNLISNDGGSIISNDGNSIVASGAGNLIGNDGASLITNDGGSLIANLNGLVAPGSHVLTDNGNLLLAGAGGSLIGNDGASLIGLNSGGSISGVVLEPVKPGAQQPDTGKRVLLQALPPIARGGVIGGALGLVGSLLGGLLGGVITIVNGLVLGAPVHAVDALGNPIGTFRFSNATATYSLTNLPTTWNAVVVESQVGTDLIRTIAPAPGGKDVRADLTAATSGIAAVVLDSQTRGNPTLGVSQRAYQADVQTLGSLMSYTDARYMLSNPTAAVASYVRTLFAAHGQTLQLNLPVGTGPLPPAPPVASPTGLGTGTSGQAGTELQVHGLGLPSGMAGLSVKIGNLAANITRIPDPTDFFVLIPPGAAPGPTTLTIDYADPAGPRNLLTQPFTVQPAPAGVPSLAVSVANPSRGSQLVLTGSNVPPGAQIGVTIGGFMEPLVGATGASVTLQVDPNTATGPQPIIVTWYDPTTGPTILLDATITVQ